MKRSGMAVVIVGATDPEQALGEEYAGHVGEDLWGPYPLEVAQEIAQAVNDAWMDVLAERGPTAFVYGPPSARVESFLEADTSTADPRTIGREAARNWYQED